MSKLILRTAIAGAVLTITAAFAVDLMQPSPIEADVVVLHESVGQVGQRATVSWIDGDGLLQTTKVLIPNAYLDESRVPLVVTQSPYVNGGWVPLRWYLNSGLVGLVIGAFAGVTFKRHPYSERPTRQTVLGAGA